MDKPTSTVYGPVKSWRFGNSVGVDPILHISTCSYSCSYCQLGKIQNQIIKPESFIETSRVIEDYKKIIKEDTPIDVITFSGSGEPTLATNLEEMSHEIRKLAPNTPQVLLTNGLHLNDEHHKGHLDCFERVVLKIDAVEDHLWRSINRPHSDVSLEASLNEMVIFSKSHTGAIDIQTMIYSINKDMDLKKYCDFLEKINPEVIYINAPSRKYPLEWDITHRGNHTGKYEVKATTIKAIDLLQFKEKICEISPELGEKVLLCKADLQ